MKDELLPRILDHLKIKELGLTVYLLADYVLRVNMAQRDYALGASDGQWQLKIANEDLEQLQKYMNGKKGVIYDNVYKAIELGELMMCFEDKGKCGLARDCWITRKGFAPCRKEPIKKQRRNNEKSLRKTTKSK